MTLLEIRLQRFRNIAGTSLRFSGPRQFFQGGNGQGKTNLLEATGYVTALRSFRSADHRPLVMNGADEAGLAMTFNHETTGETRVVIRLRPDGRGVEVDQEKISRVGDVIGRFPAVTLSSDDIQFIRQSPGLRRRWLDLALSAGDPVYLRELQRYHRGLAGRNRILKNEGGDRELSAFEQTMAETASALTPLREEGTRQLSETLQTVCGEISGGAETAALTRLAGGTAGTAEEWLALWRESREKDRLSGGTRRGLHRDDYELSLNNRSARDFASEGQQRGLVLALRLAEFRYLMEKRRVRPLLLADDIVNELDPERRRRFWKFLGEETQVLATGTEPPPEPETWQRFEVSGGVFTELFR